MHCEPLNSKIIKCKIIVVEWTATNNVFLAMMRSKKASKLEFALIIDFLHFVFNKHKLKFKKDILNKTILGQVSSRLRMSIFIDFNLAETPWVVFY